MTVDNLIFRMLREEGGFKKSFLSVLSDELHMSMNEFCHVSGISQSTMYKIMEERREPNLRTIRRIIKALDVIYSRDTEKFVAVIASTVFMVGLPRSLETLANGEVSVREYTVSSVEDAVIAAVRAERDGALAIICAPIVAETIEKITKIQVFPVMPMDSVVKILDGIKTRY